MQKQHFTKVLLFLLLTSASTIAQNFSLSNRIANYTIEVALDTASKSLIGNEKISWTNTSSDAINELQLHLYLNAFRDNNSTFMKEKNRYSVSAEKDSLDYGNIYITSFNSNRGENLFAKLKYIQPDDNNKEDRTVISVALQKPLLPNQQIELSLSFKAKLPKIIARTGYSRDFYLVGQWFPKMGVYEASGVRNAPKGRWNCHQFHANTEFYADFGTYDVTMNIPKNFSVGATGNFVSETFLKKDRKLVRYKAENVHDFAWTASPNYKVFEKKWKHVKIKALMQPEHAAQTERYFSSAILALAYFEKHIGQYPYSVLTLVDPPLSGRGAAGMEYPTFITCGTSWGVGEWARFAEIVTIHEFGHQYFQGMLATNEFEESWLDEGFNQYLEGRIVDESYGKGSQFNILGFKMDDMEASRDAYVSLPNPKITAIYRNAWQYPKGTYVVMTYSKTATWMKTLENLVGRNVMDEILQTYFIRWKFKHPSAQDFISIVNEIVEKRLGNKLGENMNWYFDQVLYNAPVCDYAITELENSGRKEPPAGRFTVERLEDMIIPTEILVVFDDKTSKILLWDGKATSRNFFFRKKIKYVLIDPKRKNLLDINRINNSKSQKQSKGVYTKYAMKALFWVQNLLLA